MKDIRKHVKTLAVCIGAQKAGTSWLFRCLQEHPDVCCAPQKEINYFGSNKELDIQHYLNNFVQCPEEKILFEGSTLYLSNPNAAQEICTLFPDAKIIVLLRDPVDRTLSHFKHQKSQHRIPQHTRLTDALHTHPELIENSRYRTHLNAYTAVFPHEQILILDYNEIKRRPQNLLNSVCDFLKIETFTPTMLRKRYNSTNARTNPLYRPIRRLYFRLNHSRIGRGIITFLKSLGINNNRIEWVLEKMNTRNEDVPLEEIGQLRGILSNEIDYYTTQFTNRSIS